MQKIRFLRQCVPLKCLAAVLLCLGCAASQPTRFYVLGPPTAPAAPSPAGTDALVIAVGPIEVPAYLDRPHLITRHGPNEVKLAEFHRWAEPLDEAVARSLAAHLGALLGTPSVFTRPLLPGTDPRFAVAVRIRQFEPGPDNTVTLDVQWHLTGGADLTRAFVLREPGAGQSCAAQTAAMDRALAALSRDIAQSIAAQTAVRSDGHTQR